MIKIALPYIIMFVFMIISDKLGWGTILWTTLNKRFQPKHNFILYLAYAGTWVIAIHWLCNLIGVSYNIIIVAIMLGLYFRFMPPFVKASQ